jgi:predicted SnoaL-like aldol condensation-catalyzing enzyme
LLNDEEIDAGFGAPVNWVAADILRTEGGVLVEQWDVIQDEATEEQSKSGTELKRWAQSHEGDSC